MNITNNYFSKILISFILFLLLGLGNKVNAADTDYYVDCDSGDDSALGTSEAEAWETLDNISGEPFEQGDIIYFKSGCEFTGYEYDWSPAVYVSSSGVEGNPITFTSYGVGDKPVFSNPQTNPDFNSVGFSIQGAWVVVDGLTITDVNNHGIWTGSGGNVTIKNCEIYDVGLGISLTADNNIITNNYIHDLKMVVNTPFDPGTPGSDDDDSGATGIVLGSSGNQVYGNTFENCIAPSYDYTVDGGAVEFYGDSVSNNVIHHNISIHTDGFSELGSSGSGTCSNNLLAYNRIYDSSSFLSVHNGGDSFATTVSNFTAENNTVFDTDGYYLMTFSQDSLSSENWNIRNNIFVGFETVSNRSGYTSEYNIYYNFDDAPTLGSNDLYADPKFSNVASLDFSLDSESPAIDSGTESTINSYDYDLLGNQVPSGGGTDRGCYELQQAEATTTTTTTTSSTSTTSSISTTTSTLTSTTSITNTTVNNTQIGDDIDSSLGSTVSTLPVTGVGNFSIAISLVLILLAFLVYFV